MIPLILFGRASLINEGIGTSFSVPISNLPELVYETKKDIEAAGLKSIIVGHVGDGNFHSLMLFETEEEKELVKGLVDRMVRRAIALEGTCMSPILSRGACADARI